MSITQFIHRGKHMYGELTAFVYDQRTTSYSEFHERVSRGAAVLRQLDASEDARVGILTAASDQAITLFFAASWAGMVPNYLNIRWSEHELAAFCRDYLAGYKVPKSFCFVEAIPLTAVGKVDKVAIRKRRS